MDFNFITPRLATGGGISSTADVDVLVAAGINVIIDCRDDFDDGILLASRSNIAYLNNGTADDGQKKPPEWFGRSLSFALPLLAQPRNRVYCHCSAGVNRGPSTVYAILRALGWTSTDALNLIHTARPITLAGVRYAADADSAIVALGYS